MNKCASQWRTIASLSSWAGDQDTGEWDVSVYVDFYSHAPPIRPVGRAYNPKSPDSCVLGVTVNYL